MSIVQIPTHWTFAAQEDDLRRVRRSMELIWDDFPGSQRIEQILDEALSSGDFNEDGLVDLTFISADALHFFAVLTEGLIREAEQRLAFAILEGWAS